MERVLLFGASGHLGRQIAATLQAQGYPAAGVVRSEKGAEMMQGLGLTPVRADVLSPGSLRGICSGYDAVISALGKSVSPHDRSRPSFMDVDLEGNTRILEEARSAGVRRFVYVSVFGAETYSHLRYFHAHHAFEKRLMASGLSYAIVRPPALFSSFLDLMELAAKGRLVTLGKGEHRTNPIDERDLAALCVAALHGPERILEAGGAEVFTRHAINALIQHAVAPSKKVRRLPLALIRPLLPLIRAFDRNSYDKFDFYLEVMGHDVLAPQVGASRLEDYIRQRLDGSFEAIGARSRDRVPTP